MNGQEQELPVVRKLLRTVMNSWGDEDGYRNPDGPEAAELITELVEALEYSRSYFWTNNCGESRLRKIDAVLTKARASTGDNQ